MNTGLSIKNTVLNESVPVVLREVKDEGEKFSSVKDAARFLGVEAATLTNYVKVKVKIIKSKITGKTYVIRKDSTK